MTDQSWTPDQALRADATDEQMVERFAYLAESAVPASVSGKRYATRIAMAREFAAACVAQLIATGHIVHLQVPPSHAPREPINTEDFMRRLSAVELANIVQIWCEGTFRLDVPFSEVAAMFRAKIAALPEDREPDTVSPRKVRFMLRECADRLRSCALYEENRGEDTSVLRHLAQRADELAETLLLYSVAPRQTEPVASSPTLADINYLEGLHRFERGKFSRAQKPETIQWHQVNSERLARIIAFIRAEGGDRVR